MIKNIFSVVYLITSALIGLGSLGHASQWSKNIYPTLEPSLKDTNFINLLHATWLFVSGCMVAIGIILVLSWVRMIKGDTKIIFVPIIISVLYISTGILAGVLVKPFFFSFLVLGVLLIVSSLLVNKAR